MSRRRQIDTSPEPDDNLTTAVADRARKALTTIRNGWPHVLDPIDAPSAGGTSGTTTRPATEDEVELPPDARLDTPLTLEVWVRAVTKAWPVTLQTLEDDGRGGVHLVRTQTVDVASVPAMVEFLHREAGRIAGWVDAGHDYGATFVSDVDKLARAVSRVAWPPKGDRITIGECPTCGRRVRVKAPDWHKRPVQVPQPTTNPKRYLEWVWIVPDDALWEADRDLPIRCRCGIEDSVEGWRERMTGPSPLLTAEQLVAEVRAQLGLRYEPATVRQWARRKLINVEGYSPQGHALYDRTQVLASLLAREKKRDMAAS